MPTEWSEAPASMVGMVEDLIERYHRDLRAARVGLILRSEPSKSQGLDVYAKAAKVDGKYAALIELSTGEKLDFLIWVAKDFWEQLDNRRREALLDHELSHCSFVTGVPKMVGHDFEDFTHIVQRHGFWNRGLFSAHEAFEQALLIDVRGPGGVFSLKSLSGAEADT